MRAELAGLWHDVFGDAYEWIERLDHDRKLETYEYRTGGRTVSALHLFDVRYMTGESIHEAKYLVGAATLEEHRKKGYMSNLIGKAVEEHREGVFLYPAVRRFYEGLGFQSPSFGIMRQKPGKTMDFENDADIERLDSIYISCFSKTGCILKDERAWKESLAENNLLMLGSAYALVSKEDGRTVECAFCDRHGLDELKAYLQEFFIPDTDAAMPGGRALAGMSTLDVGNGFFIPEIY